ncbi:hypothetical protein [Bradyrhizobium sp. URHD0069]|uniref:hypothetical protein n=1 Tax=Bradyrhizobium sp. URHD0069 TaxID=1380355 RepID=UPI0012DC2BFD|nr:hypothetical protein [Bradyrhizobium sp. URHD0069]
MAFAEAVTAAGGGAHMAAALETNPGKISRLQNTDNTPVAMSERLYLKAGEVIKADRLAGAPIMLSALAALEGYEIQAADRHVAPKGMHQHLSTLAKEFGQAVTEMADGDALSIAKARRIRTELQDLVNRARDCIAECDQIMSGEKQTLWLAQGTDRDVKFGKKDRA